MMLSRIADSLYWMGRYIERAENTCRLLKATHEFTVELSGLNDELAAQEWELLFGAAPVKPRLNVERPVHRLLHVRRLKSILGHLQH